MKLRSVVVGWLLLAAGATPLAAQRWNTPAALELARLAMERREQLLADSSLTSYRTTAKGFVFFLAQVGEEGLREAPRLVKADQLVVEVYWQAPNLSKQVVLGWRDGSFLPTDINYHRDHLGIVTNNFGDRIRIGEGDEVRDVPHPLSRDGLTLYDFALSDSLTVQGAGGAVRLLGLAARPKRFSDPRVVGTLYIDANTAQLVRFRFSFTPAAYLDSQLEDISITLESALWEGRFWLPYRQEIEIRRRFSWLDFPARGIIRGRWDIADYDFNEPFPAAVFAGPSIGGLRRPGGPDSLFSEPLTAAVTQVARPLADEDMAALRADIERIAGAQLLSGLPGTRIGGGGVSNIIRVNRVQGLALGAGAVLGAARRRVELRPALGIATATGRLTGGLEARLGSGATRLTAEASRQVVDIGDEPVIAPVLNSLSAQEFGDDYADWYERDRVRLAIRRRLGGRHSVELAGTLERPRSLEVAHTPFHGDYRGNPALGTADHFTGANIRLERGGGSSIATGNDFAGDVQVEAASGPTDFVRASARAEWLRSLGAVQLLMRGRGGWGSTGMPAYRQFVLGGRGTLVGEEFRAFGGQAMALGHVELRFQAPAPAIPLGSFASTGRTMTIAPFLSAGWVRGPGAATATAVPWQDSDGLRPVAGLGVELFMQLIRIDAGIALRTGEFGLTIDINRDWWGAL